MEFMVYQFMFKPDDRSEMGTDVLLNRFIMKTMNVMVEPQKKYILTTKENKNESWRIHSRCNKKTSTR